MLEWIIDQYQVSTDKRSGITNDPNRDDDPQYIMRLIGEVTTVVFRSPKAAALLCSAPLHDSSGEFFAPWEILYGVIEFLTVNTP